MGEDDDFAELAAIIESARRRAFQAVNRELIAMYWQVGEHISRRLADGRWGEGVVAALAAFIQRRFPELRGFSRQNLWRMRQFFETYQGNEKLSALTRQITWTNNLAVLAGAKTEEAREFYLRLAAKHGYSSRELQRQIDAATFERAMISEAVNRDVIARHPAVAPLRDSYVLEFLDLPEDHQEKDLRRALVANLRGFLLEFGKDFTLVGEEYRLQVGNEDFRIDVLAYSRELSCLMAIELKTTRFRPEMVGQMSFYLEALDRDVKKTHENPSVGLILCADKDDTVVEYALSRALSPTMVAQYQLRLPDKAVLEAKLRQLTDAIAAGEGHRDQFVP